jgi:hypothetical protein
MSKRVILILAVAVVATSLIAGSDPWKDKPYKEWDAKDVEKIMLDSPWARPVIVSATWKPTSGSAITAVAGGSGSNPGGASGGSISKSADDPAGANREAVYYVRWASSLTLRQALARKAELRGTPAEKAEQILQQQPETYIISVQGADMSPFAKVDEMSLKQKTYLMSKKTKQKLSPDRVEFRRAPNSQNILDVTFYFSKKTSSGETVVPSDEKSLEFSCETPVTKIKTNFDLVKMTGASGVDL